MGCGSSKPKPAAKPASPQPVSPPKQPPKETTPVAAPAPVKKADPNKEFGDMLKKHQIDDNPKFDDKFPLLLDVAMNKKGTSDFLKEAKHIKIPKLRRLSITAMDLLSSSDMSNLKDLLKNSRLDNVQIVYLHGSGKMNLSAAKDLLPDLLSITQHQLFLDSFSLSESDLQLVFKHATNVANLYLVNCVVGKVSKSLGLSAKQKYKLKNLDLFYSAIADSEEHLNKEKLNHIFDELAETDIAKSLKTVHVCKDDYPQKDLQALLDKHGLKSKAVADTKTPEPDE